jgi:hypothetical protein
VALGVLEKRAAALLEDLAVVLKSCPPLGLVNLVFPHPQCSCGWAAAQHVAERSR